MGFFDSLSDLWEAATPWSTAEAEAVNKDEESDGAAEDASGATSDDGDAESSDKDGEKGASGGEEEEGGDDAEEEEEEEMVDPKEKFEEECKESKQCAPLKHHFEECVERVTGADEGKAVDKKHPNEDCVEEFFHLAHCANQCAAPKLFATLK